jgi:hypothetical protein
MSSMVNYLPVYSHLASVLRLKTFIYLYALLYPVQGLLTLKHGQSLACRPNWAHYLVLEHSLEQSHGLCLQRLAKLEVNIIITLLLEADIVQM